MTTVKMKIYLKVLSASWQSIEKKYNTYILQLSNRKKSKALYIETPIKVSHIKVVWLTSLFRPTVILPKIVFKLLNSESY